MACSALGRHAYDAEELRQVQPQDVFTASTTLRNSSSRTSPLKASTRWPPLRHTCAALLLSKNVNARIVQEILGHANIPKTMDAYSHVLPPVQEAAESAMGPH